MNAAIYMEILIFALGSILGGFLYGIYQRYKLGSYQKLAAEILQKAEFTSEKTRLEAEHERKEKMFELQKQFENTWQSERRKIQQEESRLKQREDKLEERINLMEKKLFQIEKREGIVVEANSELHEERKNLAHLKEKLNAKLEEAAGITSKEAKEKLLEQVREEVRIDTANYIKKMTRQTEEDAERLASRILATAINRLAVPCVSESTVNTVALPSDELKGRIIGKEGRNIRALERATGVSFLIDDTPGAVVLSAFDPIKLHIAKHALIDLLKDGRIHPTRIEEAVDKASASIDRKIKEAGENAALRTGQINLHPEIILLLGKLNFRFSYGQNVLEHSIEVSHLMGMIASELHLDVQLAKRIGLLHDMGKAVSHEISGTHALIGRDLALKYGENEAVANGIGCHHREIDPITTEGSFCGAADAISASRPGARTEAIEDYIKRVKRLEELAYEFPGIEKAYALQAGKELCVVVVPEIIDDSGLIHLARDLTKRIEKEFHYSGKIKVSVIREKRAVEYAM